MKLPRAEKFRPTSIRRFVIAAYKLARRAVPPFSSKFSKRTYTQHQHVAILCLKVRDVETYEGVVEKVREMPEIGVAIGLKQVPDPSTLCKAFERLEASVWRVMLQLTLDYFEVGEVTGMDSHGEERGHASKYYTKRAKLHIKELKVTLLVDTLRKIVLDVHITATRRHDAKIGPMVVKRSSGLIKVLLGDKGYDDRNFRNLCRRMGIRPLIKHREFRPIQKAWNARMDERLYNQRNQCENVRSSMTRKYESYVRSRKWFKQFREVLVKCIAFNLDRFIKSW